VLKYLKLKISQSDVNKEGKDAIWNHVYALVYSDSLQAHETILNSLLSTCEKYQPETTPLVRSTNELQEAVPGHEIDPTTEPVELARSTVPVPVPVQTQQKEKTTFAQYFLKNWDTDRKLWAYYLRKGAPTLNNKLSEFVVCAIASQKDLAESANYSDEAEFDNSSYTVFRVASIDDQSLPKRHKVSRTVVDGANDTFLCECDYSSMMLLPCCHVVYILEKLQLCLFRNFRYARRWLKVSPLTFEESSSDSSHSNFEPYGAEQSASDTNLPTQFTQTLPEALVRRAQVVDRYNVLKVHMDLIMSMLVDKRRSLDEFNMYAKILEILSEQIAGKVSEEADEEADEAPANPARLEASI
jgi:hypothetical protein